MEVRKLKIKFFKKISPLFLVISLITLVGIFFFACTSSSKKESEKETEFAGSATCISCHKSVYDSFQTTAHYNSSAIATPENIKGSFATDSNRFYFDNTVYIQMDKKDGNFFQTVFKNEKPILSHQFDITIGSGRKGQSYLSWVHDTLVQMPITYFTPEGKWTNSPGYPPKKVVFNRVITSRCMECHSTYMHTTSVPEEEPERFDKSSIIYGIDCEKCHGPATKHVKFQTENPEIKEANYIVNPAKLSRQQNLDLCSLCHGGKMEKTKPSFSFSAGDLLKDHFTRDSLSPDVNNIDVHGNQYGLLSASKCFQLSQMTCGSCHNSHQNEQKNLAIFSQRCMNCHSESHGKECKMKQNLGAVINQNCIDCHMPKQPSNAVAVYLQGAAMPTPALMRTHFIKVYPEETKKIIDYLKKLKS